MAKIIIEARKKGYNAKAERAAKRRLGIQERLKEDLRRPFYGSLGDMVDGEVTTKDIKYVFDVLDHDKELEREADTFTTKRGSKVTITIVDFARNVSNNVLNNRPLH